MLTERRYLAKHTWCSFSNEVVSMKDKNNDLV